MIRAIQCGPLFETLAQANSRVLLVDYDGTIAPFRVDRNNAFPYPSVPDLLECIGNITRTRLVMVTGRKVEDLIHLLGIQPHPEIWGVHGLERLMPDGTYDFVRVHENEKKALFEAEALLEYEGLMELTETKPGAIAVHWRGLDKGAIHEARTAAYRAFLPLASQAGLLVSEFDGGVELRVAGRNKGDVVRIILAEVGEDVPVAYMGDDITDEDAFRALRWNSRGLGVLVRPEYRLTDASVWLRPPDELEGFLRDWLRASGGGA